jgi:hypothetical protein
LELSSGDVKQLVQKGGGCGFFSTVDSWTRVIVQSKGVRHPSDLRVKGRRPLPFEAPLGARGKQGKQVADGTCVVD